MATQKKTTTARSKTFTPSIQTVEKEYGETGVGQENRVETEYQLGFNVDGAFVRLASVRQAQVDAAVAKHKLLKGDDSEDEPEPDDGAAS